MHTFGRFLVSVAVGIITAWLLGIHVGWYLVGALLVLGITIIGIVVLIFLFDATTDKTPESWNKNDGIIFQLVNVANFIVYPAMVGMTLEQFRIFAIVGLVMLILLEFVDPKH